jgi:hypothetical protein
MRPNCNELQPIGQNQCSGHSMFLPLEWYVKILIFQGALDQVLKKVDSQQPLLK